MEYNIVSLRNSIMAENLVGLYLVLKTLKFKFSFYLLCNLNFKLRLYLISYVIVVFEIWL